MTTDVKTYYPYINGQPWQSEGQPLYEVNDPFNGKLLGKVHLATEADIEAALAHAHESQKSWGKTLASEREAVLIGYSDLVVVRVFIVPVFQGMQDG